MHGLREVESQRVADHVGDAAVYTGNHGQRTGLPISVNLQISDMTRTSAEVTNLEIGLAPSPGCLTTWLDRPCDPRAR